MAETIKSEARKSVNAGNAVPLTDILYRTLHHWPWVLLSLVVCVGAAVVLSAVHSEGLYDYGFDHDQG